MSELQGQSTDHQIGRISGRLDSVEKNLTKLERDIEDRLRELAADVKVIHNAVTAAGGSWRAVIWVGSVIAGLVGLATMIGSWFANKS